MSEFVLAGILYYGLCIGLSWLSRQNNRFIDYGVLHWGSMFAWLGAAWYLTLATGHIGGRFSPLFVLVVLIPGILLLIPWIGFVIGHRYEAAHKWLTGVESMKMRRSFDDAERAFKEKRFDDAEALFLEEAKRESADPDPLRRAGECRLEAGRPAEAVELMNQALAKTQSNEDRASLAFRISEIQSRRLGDRSAAERTLTSIERDLSGTRFAEMARTRLSNLSASAEAPHLS